MTIAVTAIKEKVRRKELYIIGIIGILLTVLFSGSDSNISFNGNAVTGFMSLFPMMLTAVGFMGCVLAVVLSISTIPNEYSRRTSHLVWIRDVNQVKYHCGLALGSLLSSLIGLVILYVGLVLFCLFNGEPGYIIKLPMAFMFSALTVMMVSLMTSSASVKLPAIATGFVVIVLLLLGFFHSVLGTVINLLNAGVLSTVLRWLLRIIPDLYTLQIQGWEIISGNGLDLHSVLGGLFYIYLFTVPLVLLRKKEA